MSVLEKAAALAQAIEESEELKIVREKETQLRADKAAEPILSLYFELQQKLFELQEQGKEPEMDLIEQFNQVQDKMEANPTIAEYYKAQEGLGILLQQVNAMISRALTGDDGGCSDSDCASCSGCH